MFSAVLIGNLGHSISFQAGPPHSRWPPLVGDPTQSGYRLRGRSRRASNLRSPYLRVCGPRVLPRPSHDCAGTLAEETRWIHALKEDHGTPYVPSKPGFSLSFGVEIVMASRRKGEITGAQNERDFP